MSIFFRKKEIDIESCCRLFYENVILGCAVGGVDVNTLLYDTLRNSLVAADPRFANVDTNIFNSEFVILQFELYALAWLHKFGDRTAIGHSVFTKKYLSEKGRNDIWEAMEAYNQAVARSTTIGRTPKKGVDRVYLGLVNTTRANLFDQYYNEGYDPECIARPLNRLFSDEAWKKGITTGLLLFTLCDRLGFEQDYEVRKEAHQRWFIEINDCYKMFRRSLKKVKRVFKKAKD
jgi:hypothetical protein